MSLTYRDLCVPSWLHNQPEIFFGFWGMCFNDYRRVVPHSGYSILKKWRDKYFKNENMKSELNSKFRKIFLNTMRIGYEDDQLLEELGIIEKENKVPKMKLPSRFFAFTSNVDKHHIKAGFDDEEIHEIHGSIEEWQCSRVCVDTTWNAPQDFYFEIDKDSMKAPLKKQDPNIDLKNEKGWQENYPRCPYCDDLSRPAILMFEDGLWKRNAKSEFIYRRWKESVKEMIKSSEVKAVILEIGCGLRVPTVRYESESYLRPGNNCTLIRINVDFPTSDSHGSNVISIAEKGIIAVQSIDKYITQLEENKKNE